MADAIYVPKSDILDLITEEYEAGGFKNYSDYSNLWDTVDDMPAADVQPVKRVKWESTNNPSFRKCSECGAWWSSDITDNCFTKYCPKCGARMIKDGDTE